jgi:hypothetical protein
MSKQGGLGHALWWHGNDVSGDITAVGTISGGPAVLTTTGINKSAIERIGGVRDGSLSATSWWNPDAGGSHAVFSALPTTDVVLTYACGTTLGVPAACLVSKQIGYDGSRADDGSFTFALDAQANGYGLEWGLLGTPGIRTDTTATNGTAVDNGASSTYGLQAYLHLFAFTGTSVTAKLQDSPDGSTWTDVAGAAFAAASTVGAQRIAVTGNVNRYLRVATTGTFTNAQFAVVIARNTTAVSF